MTLPDSSRSRFITHDDLAPFFADEHWTIKEALHDFIACCQSLKSQPLRWRDKPAQRFLVSVSSQLNQAVSDFDQLKAYEIALTGIWHLYLDVGISLDPPAIRMQLAPEKAYPAQPLSSLPLITELTESIYAADRLFSDNQHRWARFYLVIAFESQVTDLNVLDQIMDSLMSEKPPLKGGISTDLLILTLEEIHTNKRIYLGPLTTLLLKQSRSNFAAGKDGKIPIPGAQAALNSLLKHLDMPLTAHQLIKQIVVLDRAVDAEALLRDMTPLSMAQLEGALTGYYRDEQASGSSERHIPLKRLITPEVSSAGSKTKNRSTLTLARRLLHSALVDPVTQKRSKARTRSVLSDMEPIIKESALLQHRLMLAWLYQLIKSGSGFKSDLAASTLQTYFSVISVFVRSAFQDCDMLQFSDKERNERVEIALQKAAERESSLPVLLRFLQFALEQVPALNINLSAFGIEPSQASVRAHYIPPAVFDRTCAHIAEVFPAAASSLLALQLAYYAGLRRDELLSLKRRDIHFETQTLYITADKQRKSALAVRKFPLCLLPEAVEQNLAAYMHTLTETENFDFEALLFDSVAFESLEVHFFDKLRAVMKNDRLVLHSLRHSCANNLLFLMESMAHALDLAEDAAAPFFLTHTLFSKAHKERVRSGYLLWQVNVTVGFPVLSEIALRLGHSSPAVTVQNYLHLLDLSLLYFTRSDVSIEWQRKHGEPRFLEMKLLPRLGSPSLSGAAKVLGHAARGLETEKCRRKIDSKMAVLRFNFDWRPHEDFMHFVVCVRRIVSNQSDTQLNSLVLQFLREYKGLHPTEVASIERQLTGSDNYEQHRLLYRLYQIVQRDSVTVTQEKALHEMLAHYYEGRHLIKTLRDLSRCFAFYPLICNADTVSLQLENIKPLQRRGQNQALIHWQQACDSEGIKLVNAKNLRQDKGFGVRLRPRSVSLDRFEDYILCAVLLRAWIAFRKKGNGAV